jgi:hypothetical protein
MADDAAPRRKIKLKPRVAHEHPVWPELIRRAQQRVNPPTPAVVAEADEGLWGLHHRTVVSIARTVIFAGLALFLVLRSDRVTSVLDAAIYGAVLADYLTWFIWSFLMLPRYLAHGLYETVINVLLGAMLSRSWAVDTRGDESGELVATMFVVFLLVITIKVFCLSLTFLEHTLADDW